MKQKNGHLITPIKDHMIIGWNDSNDYTNKMKNLKLKSRENMLLDPVLTHKDCSIIFQQISTNLGKGWEKDCLKLLTFVSNINAHGSNND